MWDLAYSAVIPYGRVLPFHPLAVIGYTINPMRLQFHRCHGSHGSHGIPHRRIKVRIAGSAHFEEPYEGSVRHIDYLWVGVGGRGVEWAGRGRAGWVGGLG